MHLVVFEDQWEAFSPLSLSRPVFWLLSGSCTFLQKQLRSCKPSRLTLWVRPQMEAFCRRRIVPKLNIATDVNRALDDEPALLINGRTMPRRPLPCPDTPCIAVDQSQTLHAACVRMPGLNADDLRSRGPRWQDLLKLPTAPAHELLVQSLWELICGNEQSLRDDLEHEQNTAPAPPGPYHLVNEANVLLGPDVKLSPGCVLDASKGPVAIGAGATIGANAIITGPCWIGPHARVRPLAQIREGTSIGPVCTVGGEVSNSIMLGYSNKAHDGFLGHSYLGKWVNFGAATVTSNLKNTYGEIRARVGKTDLATGRQFLGSIVGDHSKTAIQTRLSAGTYVGFCSMIATSATAPRMVPSFTFLTDEGPRPYHMDKAIEVSRRVLARRDAQFDQLDEQVMRYVADLAPTVEL